MHKNDPTNPDLYVAEDVNNKLPTREDILNATFRIERDLVQSHKYMILADEGGEPLATICIVSTKYLHINKMLAEMILDGLKALKTKKNKSGKT